MTASLEAGLGLGFGFEGIEWIPERRRIHKEQDLYQFDVERVGGVKDKGQVLA